MTRTLTFEIKALAEGFLVKAHVPSKAAWEPAMESVEFGMSDQLTVVNKIKDYLFACSKSYPEGNVTKITLTIEHDGFK
jgi:hypothetical protein